MGTIIPFLRDEAVFEPDVTSAMSAAYDDVCRALKLSEAAAHERETVAIRIVELARQGERDPVRLRERLLRESRAAI
jgi:hypothetical protein